ncbi:MAG: LysR family transcriptional regulator [Alphaproteobacteria bacterium]|nr:LysR family transcriptional regulator [Alphaproteobacteria bacterium]
MAASEFSHPEPSDESDSIDWDDFRVFLEVVRTGSFNRAAMKLKMTQPTVSRRLQRLEEAINVRLFDRDRKGPRLTVEGQRIYSDTCTAQAALERAASHAAGARKRVEGDCKILMGEGVASYWMSRFLAPFFNRYPNIELKVFGSNDASQHKRELFDLCVHYFEPSQAEPIAVRLGTMYFIPFASREYLRTHGAPQRMDALSGHRMLDLATYVYKGSWASWSRSEASAQALLFTNLTGCLAESVRHGAGIALLPTYAATVDHNFVPLDVGVHFTAPIFVSYQRDAVKRRPVGITLDFLRNHVFDQKRMPWFRETYHASELDWHKRLSDAVHRAAAPHETTDSISAD